MAAPSYRLLRQCYRYSCGQGGQSKVMKMAVFWDAAHNLFTALMMEAVSTSETSVNFYQTTWRNIPEDSHLYTRSSENLKSHKVRLCLVSLESYTFYEY
jgi:hypothetical protein